MKKKLLILSVISVALVVAAGIAFWGQETLPENRPHFQLSDLTITHSDGTVISFKSEIALTRDEQAYGLMFIHSLPDNQAMIFPYTPPQEVAFWMKNTLIPLDMLFVTTKGTIGRIVENAAPEDITPIPSQIPVSAVIEIGGGLVKKDGIAVGDKISSPVLQSPDLH